MTIDANLLHRAGRQWHEIGEGIGRARKPLAEANHLPSSIYTSEEIFALEKEKIFKKDWLAVARVEELEKPGDYMTFDIVGEPIIVARDGDGEINAFYNVCVHRGTEVAAGSGNLKTFSCPYHAWTYDLAGRLVGAAYMDDVKDFDLDGCRLQPVRCGVWQGWVFVSFDAEAEPLESFVAEYAEAFGPYQQQRFRLNQRVTKTLDCNWKLIHENFVDIYHFLTLHPETLANWQGPEDYEYRALKHGGYATFYENETSWIEPFRELGLPEWLRGWPEGMDPALAGCSGFMTPNFTIFGRVYGIVNVLVWPVSPAKSTMDIYCTVPEQYFRQDDIVDRVRPIEELMGAIIEEDRPMIESLQRNMAKGAFRPGRMSSGEMLVHHYIGCYLDRMAEGLPEA